MTAQEMFAASDVAIKRKLFSKKFLSPGGGGQLNDYKLWRRKLQMCLAFSLLEALFYHDCQVAHAPILKSFLQL